jgi:cytochrome P450
MTTTEVHYDPFDFEIDDDPYPIWKTLRDEAPLYRNDKYNFYALSRYEDVAPELTNWDAYRSGRGTTIDIIMSNIDFPPGIILFEDPPIHDLHRRLLSRVFTPRRMEAIEPLTREFCVRALDPLVGTGRFDFIENIGAMVPMRTVGYLLGIPEENQEEIRDRGGAQLTLNEGTFRPVPADFLEHSHEMFADYIDWRVEHPSDDLMTQLLNAEFEDGEGSRRLTRSEVLLYVSTIAGAGNETTTRLIGFAGQLLAQHPDQRRELAENPSLIPMALEEVLRYEAPSPVQARHVVRDVACRGVTVPEGSIMLLLNGSANRDERKYPDPDTFDIHRGAAHLSFGHGLHFCLGSALARMQARVVLEEVLKRWPDWEIDYANATKAHTTSVRGWSKLPVFTG